MVKTGEISCSTLRELSQILDQNLKEVGMMNEKVRDLKVKINDMIENLMKSTQKLQEKNE